MLRFSTTPGAVPSSLLPGRIGINEADSKFFYRSPTGTVLALPLGPWTQITAPVTAGSGTITTASATVRYQVVGKRVDFTATVAVTTNGSGGAFVALTLPVVARNTTVFFGHEGALTGNSLKGVLYGTIATVQITNAADNSYPGGDGRVLYLSGSYEAQ